MKKSGVRRGALVYKGPDPAAKMKIPGTRSWRASCLRPRALNLPYLPSVTDQFGGYLIFCLAFASLFGTDGTLLAQPTGARISGSVVDPQGQVLPDATVMLEPTGTPDSSAGVLATTTTDRLGRFSFDDITPGTYVVTVELSGYSPTAAASGRLAAGQSAVLTIAMAIAPLSEIVDVVASTGAGEPVEADEIEPDLLRVFQLPTDRFQEALPTLQHLNNKWLRI